VEGTLSSIGIYFSKLSLPLDAVVAGLGEGKIVTTLYPRDDKRMRCRMNGEAFGRADLKPMATHRFKLNQIEKADDSFANRRAHCSTSDSRSRGIAPFYLMRGWAILMAELD
jgi:alcohol dehydrogenase